MSTQLRLRKTTKNKDKLINKQFSHKLPAQMLNTILISVYKTMYEIS